MQVMGCKWLAHCLLPRVVFIEDLPSIFLQCFQFVRTLNLRFSPCFFVSICSAEVPEKFELGTEKYVVTFSQIKVRRDKGRSFPHTAAACQPQHRLMVLTSPLNGPSAPGRRGRRGHYLSAAGRRPCGVPPRALLWAVDASGCRRGRPILPISPINGSWKHFVGLPPQNSETECFFGIFFRGKFREHAEEPSETCGLRGAFLSEPVCTLNSPMLMQAFNCSGNNPPPK